MRYPFLSIYDAQGERAGAAADSPTKENAFPHPSRDMEKHRYSIAYIFAKINTIANNIYICYKKKAACSSKQAAYRWEGCAPPSCGWRRGHGEKKREKRKDFLPKRAGYTLRRFPHNAPPKRGNLRAVNVAPFWVCLILPRQIENNCRKVVRRLTSIGGHIHSLFCSAAFFIDICGRVI